MDATKWGLAALVIAIFPIHAVAATVQKSVFVTTVNYK
jgi:hypothetical protein